MRTGRSVERHTHLRTGTRERPRELKVYAPAQTPTSPPACIHRYGFSEERKAVSYKILLASQLPRAYVSTRTASRDERLDLPGAPLPEQLHLLLARPTWTQSTSRLLSQQRSTSDSDGENSLAFANRLSPTRHDLHPQGPSAPGKMSTSKGCCSSTPCLILRCVHTEIKVQALECGTERGAH